jgi:hypothetical protein
MSNTDARATVVRIGGRKFTVTTYVDPVPRHEWQRPNHRAADVHTLRRNRRLRVGHVPLTRLVGRP